MTCLYAKLDKGFRKDTNMGTYLGFVVLVFIIGAMGVQIGISYIRYKYLLDQIDTFRLRFTSLEKKVFECREELFREKVATRVSVKETQLVSEDI